jgi:hypothetical protein
MCDDEKKGIERKRPTIVSPHFFNRLSFSLFLKRHLQWPVVVHWISITFSIISKRNGAMHRLTPRSFEHSNSLMSETLAMFKVCCFEIIEKEKKEREK